jgi:hypothetical protein
MFNGGKLVLIWTAISYDGPEQLYFIEGTKDKDCYEEILEACLPDIQRL